METFHIDDQPLDFDEFANQLLEQGAEQSPAHLHGAVCGVLAGGGKQDPEYCLSGVAQVLGMDIHGELAGNCLRLSEVTLAALRDEEFDFRLFLPDDETEIEVRVAALSHWCSAFMTGFALAVAQPGAAPLAEETSEILKDISAIAEAGVDHEADEEDAESDFFELTEYLRFATLNLFMDQVAGTSDGD
jgi:uncharacterized protein YgfB (UPF0149 family)